MKTAKSVLLLSGMCNSRKLANQRLYILVLLSSILFIIQVPQQANSIKTTTTTPIDEVSGASLAADSTIKTKQRPTTTRTPNIEANNKVAKQKQQTTPNCQYEKGQWNECNAEGVQLRTMRLKSGSSESCEPIRTIRRDCKTVGCKYARGEWSELCQDGHRVRVDKLIGRIGNATKCKLERRVAKDCRRTCHYIKSAWSECTNGTKTRNLTLDDGGATSSNSIVPAVAAAKPGRSNGASLLVTMAPIGQNCVPSKLVRRDCRNALPNLSTTTTTGAAATTTTTSNNNPQQAANSSPGRNNNMTASQRRRLKLQQLKQARPLQREAALTTTATTTSSSQNSNNNLAAETATTMPRKITTSTTTTTTTPKRSRRRR